MEDLLPALVVLGAILDVFLNIRLNILFLRIESVLLLNVECVVGNVGRVEGGFDCVVVGGLRLFLFKSRLKFPLCSDENLSVLK